MIKRIRTTRLSIKNSLSVVPAAERPAASPKAPFLLVAEVLVGLATDAAVYFSLREGALKVFHHPRFRFLMAPWAPRAPSVS